MYANSSESNVDLVTEYSPSFNTKRFQDDELPNERVLQNFVENIKSETELVRKKYKTRLDVRYGPVGDHDNQLLDIFFKEKEAGPIFVYIHGGFWQCLDKSTSGSFVSLFVERNWRVLNVDYNLCPAVSLNELCEQMWNFYEWLFKYAVETKASSIVVCGHSAGAHLASLLFTDRAFELIQNKSLKISFLLISGLYDLRELWNLECSNPENVLNLNAELAEKLSPICWKINEKLIEMYKRMGTKIYIIAAENDSTTFKGQTSALAKKFTHLGLNVFSKIFDNYDHFDIIEEAAIKDSQISKYILENIN